MDGISYFLTHALLTLIPLVAAAFGLGLWLGWLRWYRWKKEYSAVETDFHKLYDHHDAATAAIESLENVRGTLSNDQQRLQDQVLQFKEANDGYAAEYDRLKASLAATQRNSKDLEAMWRGKLADAQNRIKELETQVAGQGTGTAAANVGTRSLSPALPPAAEAAAVPPESHVDVPAQTEPEIPVPPFISNPPAGNGNASSVIPFPQLERRNPPSKETKAKSQKRGRSQAAG